MLIYSNIALHYGKKSREKAFILVVIKNGKYLETDLFDA